MKETPFIHPRTADNLLPNSENAAHEINDESTPTWQAASGNFEESHSLCVGDSGSPEAEDVCFNFFQKTVIIRGTQE
jgi:hypothetical protein